MKWNQIGILTDEVSSDLNEALEFACEHRLAHVELRTIGGTNVIERSDRDLGQIRRKIEERGLFVSVFASPVFKCALSRYRPVAKGDVFGVVEADVATHFRMLERAIEIAKCLGTTRIRIFSFWREESPELYEDEIVEHLRRAATIAEAKGALLLLENEPACNGGTAEEVGRLVRRVNSPALRALWDPGNEVYAGRRPFPKGYLFVKDIVRHVHLKDASLNECGLAVPKPIGLGLVPFKEQLRALDEDGYNGLYTVEPHYIPPGGTLRDGAEQALAWLKVYIQEKG